MKTTRCCCVGVCTAILLSVAPISAQSLPQDKRAVVAFDIDFQRLDAMGLGQFRKAMQDQPPFRGGDGEMLRSAVRIQGAVSAPLSLSDMQSLGPDDSIPLDFFARVQLDNKDSLKKLVDKMEDVDQVTENGITWYKPREGSGGPPNMRMRMVDDTTFEFGTIGFMSQPDRNVHTTALADLWKKTPDCAIRLAADFDRAGRLLTTFWRWLSSRRRRKLKDS